jgi:N-acetylneuraminic acid mutarotase
MNKSKLSFGVVLVLSVFLLLCCSNSEKTLSPPGLGYHSMAYDEESNITVIFGGKRGNYDAYLNMTWAYRNNDDTWALMTPEVIPMVYTDTAMAYDSESDRIIMFTGHETWSYDYNSNEWQKKNPARSPIAISGFCISYDMESDRVILFGITTNETWVYDYNSDKWTLMSPKSSPPVRQYSAMAYDSESDRIVLFGGGREPEKVYYFNIVLDDTWLYDYNSNSWTEVKSAIHPNKRVYHTMAYNPSIDRIILFGGWSFDDQIPMDDRFWTFDTDTGEWETYEFDQKLTPKRNHTMIFDSHTGSIIIHGGIAITFKTIGMSLFLSEEIILKMDMKNKN